MYIEVQDRYYKVKNYTEAVKTLRMFSFSKYSKTNKQYRDATARRYREVFGNSPFYQLDTKNDESFILSLARVGEINIKKTNPKDVKGPTKTSKAKMSGIKLKG